MMKFLQLSWCRVIGATLGILAASFLMPCTAMAGNGRDDASKGKSLETSCLEQKADVLGASTEERTVVCTAVKKTTKLFRQCGFMKLPRIRVQVEKEPVNVCGVDAFGSYDAQRQTIRIVDATTCEKMAKVNAAYASLPFGELYQSIVVHEIAHQFFRSHLKDKKASHATHEYIAYAMQIASMPPQVRDQLLNSFPREPPEDLGPFVDMLLLMSPMYFGVLAYDHFSAPGNGCRVLQEIVRGEIEFPSSDEPY
jgi:Family of unknown function (DUF6639)